MGTTELQLSRSRRIAEKEADNRTKELDIRVKELDLYEQTLKNKATEIEGNLQIERTKLEHGQRELEAIASSFHKECLSVAMQYHRRPAILFWMKPDWKRIFQTAKILQEEAIKEGTKVL